MVGWKNFGKGITYLSNLFDVKQQVLTMRQSISGKQKYPTLLPITPSAIFSMLAKRDYVLEFYLIKPWRSKTKNVVEEKFQKSV